MALQKLFGSKAHLVDYMFLGNISTSITSCIRASAKCSKRNPRSRSERNATAQRFLDKNFPEPHQLLGFKAGSHPNNIDRAHLVIPRSKWDMFDKDTISLKRKVGFHRVKIHDQDFFEHFCLARRLHCS